MKSLLVLLAAVPLLASAQAPVQQAPVQQAPSPPPKVAAPAVAPSATPASLFPDSTTPAPSGATHDAAATVPLPGQSSGPTLEKNIPLMPETPRSGSRTHSRKAQPGATPHEFATFQTEHDLRIRIRLREAETRALNDPGIQADWAAAHRVRTDPERRALLTVYYDHLYGRMMKIDPSLSERIKARRESSIARMKYTRLGDVNNSEDPFVAPAQAASGVNPPSSDSTSY